MKTLSWILGAGVVLALAADLPGSGPPVLETEAEYFAWGEFRGDGRRSFVVIDRESGGVRLMGATAADGLVRGPTHAVGIEGVTGVAVGRFGATTRDDVAVTAPQANRVRVVSPQGGQSLDVWPSGVGPELVVGVPLVQSDPGFSGMAATSVWNRPQPLGPHRRGLMARISGQFELVGAINPDERARQILAVTMEQGGALRYAEVYEDEFGDWGFAVLNYTDPWWPVLASIADVPPGSRVIWGPFNPLFAQSVFLFHVPGSDQMHVSVANADGSLGSLLERTLPEPMAWIQAVEAGGAWRIVGCTLDGSMLRIFAYGANNRLTPLQNMAPPPGERWTGLMPDAGGNWFAASAVPGQPTSRLTRHFYQGGLMPFAAGASYTLEPLRRDELSADVLLFAGRPFHDNEPALKGRLRAGGWTSSLSDNPQFAGMMEGVIERWRGPDAGLGDPQAVQLGARPAPVTHGLGNQIAPDASFFSLEAPVGAVPDLILFEPEPGAYNEAIEIELLTASPATTVYYAIDGSQDWQVYSGLIGPIYRDTVVRAYAYDSEARSPVQSAAYTFPESLLDVDSDGDGVPDFIKDLYGIDPLTGGLDSDGNGVSDLFEILLGSDPTDPDDMPSEQDILSLTRRFSFWVRPLSHSGVGPHDPLVFRASWHPDKLREGTWVTLHRPDGGLALEGWAEGTGGGTGEVAFRRSNHVVADPPLFWVAATPDRFMINDNNPPGLRHGRGLFGIFANEAEPMSPLPRPELSGTTWQMAQQWIAAVRDHLEARSLVEANLNLTYLETLHLLLVEQALGAIFRQRSLTFRSHVTLTPFRGDVDFTRSMPGGPIAGRRSVSDAMLAGLSERGPTDHGYLWGELLDHMREGGTPVGRQALEATAREVYRIGFHAYNDPDDPLTIPPFDALRQLFETGALPDAYSDRQMIPQDVVDRAVSALDGLLKGLPQRAFTTSPLPLVAGENFDRSPWIVLRHEHTHAEYWLADREGNPMPAPLGFRILPGFQFIATGHVTDHPSGGYTLWVESIALAGAPMPGWSDSDWNALDDGWEAFLFGRLGNNPFLDLDGDGYSLLQEMLEGTDPHYADDFPSVPVVEFTMPQVHIESLAPYQFRLSWHWNNPYDNRLGFHLQGGEDLIHFTPLLDLVPRLPDGLYEVDVDPPTDGPPPGRYFFRAGLRLIPEP